MVRIAFTTATSGRDPRARTVMSHLALATDEAAREDRGVLLFTETVSIAASPSSVFPWIADPERARRWQPDVNSYEVTHETPDLVGTEFREWLGDGRGRLEMQGRITRCVRDESIAFEVSGGGVEVSSRYFLFPAPAGTALRAELDFRLRGRLSFLLEQMLRRRIHGQMRRELDTLRRLCETEVG